jgi:hypothetical protein
VDGNNSISSFPMWIPLISPLWLIVLARPYNTE